jgi:hypothetical protein
MMSEKTEKNLFTKMVSVFWEPSACFAALKRKINWMDIVIPFLLVIIAGMIASTYIMPIAFEEQTTRIENSDKFPNEQKEAMIERMEKRIDSPMNYVNIIIANGVKLLIIAGVMLFIANFLLGGELKYKTLLGVSAYIGLIDIINSAVKTPMIISQDTTRVYTSIALFMEESNSYFFRLMSQIDIFAIWKIALFSIAIAVLLQKKATKTALPIAAVWLIYALGAAALAGLANF